MRSPGMQNKILIILGVFFFGGAGLLLLAQTHVDPKSQQGKTLTELYYCPMHPTYTSNKPGNCPICQMKLVKKEKEELSLPSATQKQSLKDICYLHQCNCKAGQKKCPMMLMVAKEGEKVICPVCGKHVAKAGKQQIKKKGDRKILYWTDPMIPGFKSDKPGKSPMGMDLVPVYSEEDPSQIAPKDLPEGYASVYLSPQKQQLIGVTTAPAISQRMVKTIRAAGTIAHDPDLYQAEAEYIAALSALEEARKGGSETLKQAEQLLEASTIRLKHLGLSEELIQEVASRKEPEHSLLFPDPGKAVWVYGKIYEYELPFVRMGQEVSVEIPALKGKTFKGTVRAIDPVVDPMTRTVRVRVTLAESEAELRPDLYVNIFVSVDLGLRLSVPAQAIFDTGTKQILFVEKGQGIFEPRAVKIGVKTENLIEIASGLKEGEKVVTSGNFLIDSESRLRGAFQQKEDKKIHHEH